MKAIRHYYNHRSYCD